ncbi:cilia- and flagella-associated protein 161 [Corythoichthys intestinalis]|uniref:cilia- and flagella-associated protein 161 n=1 Tax=Corythoichthys intestinalis TaxID=161448 RepID=UPI0025A5154A|nr:cilia- and flagella-associated protein 161 [Corythoichthys intestinalis]XP_061812311.1 cilia- and flagella-associated protein 161-like [Nerophis lumbriciformis]
MANKMTSMPDFKTYRTSVKIGNWNEEQHLEEHVRNKYLRKRENGELTAQRVDFLKNNILTPVKLSVTNDGALHFGDVVMLVNVSEVGECYALGINAYIDNMIKVPSPGIKGPCGVSAGRSIQPSARTAFTITSVDGTPEGATLHYEQSFALKTANGFTGGLYLTSDARTFRKNALRSRLQEVNLDANESFLSWWKMVHFDPQERLEHEGLPVPANVNVVLLHCKTHQALAVMEHLILGTTYGNEFEVTAHTFLDGHKAEKSNNHWILCTADPAGEGLLLLNRLKLEGNCISLPGESPDGPTEYITCSVCNYREHR